MRGYRWIRKGGGRWGGGIYGGKKGLRTQEESKMGRKEKKVRRREGVRESRDEISIICSLLYIV